MVKIAICDDDSAFAEVFQRQLSAALAARAAEARLAVFSDPGRLLAAVEGGQEYDLLFLDIVFSRSEEGLRLAAALRQRRCPAEIVFISVSPDYAVASYDVEALYYLTKPVEEAKLAAALDRFLTKRRPASLRFISSQGSFTVALADILYFEIYSHRIIIHKVDGENESCVGTLKELEGRLPANTFVRPHRSYLVNLDHIYKITRGQIHLSSGDAIPVSRDLYQSVQKAFIDRAGRRDPAVV